MRLITGGAYQGKLEYAVQRYKIVNKVVDAGSCQWEDLLKASLADHFHLWIRKVLKDGGKLEDMLNRLLAENPDIIIIVDELGCGIVPMDAFDRNYREITGRICCRLAGEAQEVHRVICGIGTVIKSG